MSCSHCGHENREGAKFCEECGTPLARQCPACGHEVRPAARFCDQCGRPVAAATAQGGPAPVREVAGRIAEKLAGYTPKYLADKILTSRAALVGERKQVTVLFADVAGFTALSARVDPEELHDIMDGCFRRLIDAVHRYEGTINQFTGDGVMALFGAPVAHEDHAVRAVAAALAVQSALAPYGEELRGERGVEFAVRIGLNTGPVVVGRIGDDLRMDYTAQGETVNLAARLQAAADPGGVLVSEATERLVQGFFVTAGRGPIPLKGFAAPVAAFAVTGQRRRRARFDVALERGLTPLAGRDRELELLRHLAERAKAGRGQVISVVGEAGIGKSRLVYELRRTLAERDMAVLGTSCPPHGEALPLHLIAEILRGALGLDAGSPRETGAAAVDAAVAAVDPSLVWTAPYVEHVLGLPADRMEAEGLDQMQRKRRMIEAFKAVVLQSARARPLALMIEDLQWIDPGSEESLGALVDAIGQHPVLVVSTCRPGCSPPWEARSIHQRLVLEPLGDEESAALVAAILGASGGSRDVRAAVVQRAGGNPLFLEELAGYVRRGGSDGGSRSETEGELPATVHDLVAARIDRLAEPLKEMLQLAAVLGRAFSLRVLEALAGEGRDVRGDLADLVHLELLEERELVPEIRFRFTHPITCEVAYQGLLLRSRADLHTRAGDALERLYAARIDEVLPDLARHHARGHDAAKALRFLVRAGDRAASLFAYAEADAWYRQALEAAARSAEGDRATVLERMGDAAFASGEVRAALGSWREALVAIERRDDRRHTADLTRKIGVGLWTAAERDAALSHLERALAALGEDRENLSAARIHQELARIHFRLGAHDRAVAAAERALELGTRLDAADVVSHAYNTLGLAIARSGEIERGVEHVERSLETARAADLASAACRAYVNLAILCMTVDHGRSIAYAREGLELARRIGDQLQQAWLSCALAAGHCSLGGDYDAGVDAAEQAIEMDRRLGQKSHLPIPLILLAQIHQCRGEAERSRRYYLEALEVAEAVGEPQLLVPCYDGLATLAIEREDEQEADEWLAHSRRVQQETGWSSDVSLLLPFVS